jgi:hypothetical protein
MCLDVLRQSRPPYLTPPEDRVAQRRAAGESVAGGKKVVPDLLAPATPPRGRIAVDLLAWLSHLGQRGVSRERLAEMEISLASDYRLRGRLPLSVDFINVLKRKLHFFSSCFSYSILLFLQSIVFIVFVIS